MLNRDINLTSVDKQVVNDEAISGSTAIISATLENASQVGPRMYVIITPNETDNSVMTPMTLGVIDAHAPDRDRDNPSNLTDNFHLICGDNPYVKPNRK